MGIYSCRKFDSESIGYIFNPFRQFRFLSKPENSFLGKKPSGTYPNAYRHGLILADFYRKLNSESNDTKINILFKIIIDHIASGSKKLNSPY